MKLYATTTSERASKGQGGNEKLEISIFVGKSRMTLAELSVEQSHGNVSLYSLLCNGDVVAECIETSAGEILDGGETIERSRQLRAEKQKAE